MGSMQSPVERIQNLNFSPIPKNKVIPGNVVRIDRVTVILGAKGALYTDSQPLNKKAFCSGAWHFSGDVAECLYKLKVITKDEFETHINWLNFEETSREDFDNARDALTNKNKIMRCDKKKLQKVIDGLTPRYKRQINELIVSLEKKKNEV